ncbi:hypothetical protein P7C71_g5734, partial [Lecanoromycetidae sp. Uapishka_2]
MQNYSFAPPNMGVGVDKKNYVFVDEHNRHKRLKDLSDVLGELKINENGVEHEDCFMDVPRLSTVQALLLLLKARESAPKRGYYWRSWMTVKKLVTMAHDLELQDHHADHQAGRSCGSDPTECLIKTRIWQNIFVCEMMIGGRTDMGVNPETVDLNIPRPLPGIDSSDYQVSRSFTYFVRKVRPPLDAGLNHPMLTRHESHGQVNQVPQYHPQQPMTPPESAGLDVSHERKLPPASMNMMSNGLPQNMPLQTTAMGNEQVEWNPTPIFAQWNTAFLSPAAASAAPSNSLPQQSPPIYPPSSMSSQPIPSLQHQQSYPEQSYSSQSTAPSLSRVNTAPHISSYSSPAPSFVTSSMWRDTVASTYDPGGLKRRYDSDSNFLLDTVQNKRTR